MAPGSWGNVEGYILPAPSSRNMGLRRVVGGGPSSTYLQHIGQAWQWSISALSWQHHSAFDGCLSRNKLLFPASGYQKPPGVEVAIIWGLTICHEFLGGRPWEGRLTSAPVQDSAPNSYTCER